MLDPSLTFSLAGKLAMLGWLSLIVALFFKPARQYAFPAAQFIIPAILAVGATVDTPVVRDGEVVVRPIMTVTLSCDHRATSGAGGAQLLQSLKRCLEQPVLLMA